MNATFFLSFWCHSVHTGALSPRSTWFERGTLGISMLWSVSRGNTWLIATWRTKSVSWKGEPHQSTLISNVSTPPAASSSLAYGSISVERNKHAVLVPAALKKNALESIGEKYGRSRRRRQSSLQAAARALRHQRPDIHEIYVCLTTFQNKAWQRGGAGGLLWESKPLLLGHAAVSPTHTLTRSTRPTSKLWKDENVSSCLVAVFSLQPRVRRLMAKIHQCCRDFFLFACPCTECLAVSCLTASWTEASTLRGTPAKSSSRCCKRSATCTKTASYTETSR